MIRRTTQYDGAGKPFSSAIFEAARCTSAIWGGRRSAIPSINVRIFAGTR